YSTLAGGDKEDLGYRIAVDAANSAYVTGYTLSANFPVRNAFQPALGGATDAFVFKLSPAGDSLLYSTYLGGSADDLGQGSIAVDAAGSAYVSGGTASPNFPTRNAAQPTYGGGASDAFVVRLAPAGNALLYSTFIGGREEDRAYGLALDSHNAVYITGRSSSPDLPAATNALRVDTGRFDMFLARLAPDSSVSLVIASPPALIFNASGSSPSALTVALSSSGSPATFSISTAVQSGGGWLSATTSPTSLTPAILTVRVNPAGLAEGIYQGTVTVNVSGAVSAPVNIPVTLNVIAPPVITSISPASLTVNAADARITILGSGFRNDSTVAINGVAISTSFLNANTLQAVVPLNQFASAGSLQVSVVNAGVSSNIFSLPVAGTGPTFSAASIVNAATFAGGPVSPGELITIFGSLLGPAQLAQAGVGSSDVFPSILAETRVLFDGVAAPLVYVQAGQVTAVVPYSMAGKTSTAIEIEYRGQRSIPVGLAVVPASPGLFTSNSSGRGQAAVLNQDGTLNSPANPAPRGSVVVFYGTGEGVGVPLVTSGQVAGSVLPKPLLPVSVRIGGAVAEIQYAGAAPGLIAGIIQVNAKVPEDAPAGPAVPLTFTVGSASSPAGVTIAIR
ncbi:MAG TPA: IPT/TIG domain-containing protein, partial [Bryobacteraceae bacterium]|nr:IPT/TIG domain-containing protein [Bryobacteraceae bacterium]